MAAAPEPVPLAALEAALEAAAPPGTLTVWLLGKSLAMQDWTQSLYLWVASGEPSPWSHSAAHSVVSTAWEELGRATPTQAAWQVTSPSGQATAQLCWGVRTAEGALAGALVMEASWGMAKAPTAKRRTAEYFILIVVVGWCDLRREYEIGGADVTSTFLN